MSDHPQGHESIASPTFSAKALGRLQVFHPISLLLLIASFAVTSVVIHPTLSEVSRQHLTYFNPNETWLLGYWALLLLLQVGTTLSLALASGDRTKALLTNGLSLSLPVANLSLAIWAPIFIIETRAAHITAEIFLGIATLVLLFSTLITGIKQVYHPTWRRPVEWTLVHVPLRMFLAILLHADIWQQGFIAFDLANGPHGLKKTIWPTFIIIVSVGVITSLWIFATTDIAFGLAGIYLQLAILFHPKITIGDHRPPEVLAASILSISLQAIALFASLAWNRLTSRGEGRIALPIEDEAVDQAEYEARVAEERARKRRQEAQRLREGGEEDQHQHVTPSQLERGEAHAHPQDDDVEVTRRLGNGSGSQ